MSTITTTTTSHHCDGCPTKTPEVQGPDEVPLPVGWFTVEAHAIVREVPYGVDTRSDGPRLACSRACAEGLAIAELRRALDAGLPLRLEVTPVVQRKDERA